MTRGEKKFIIGFSLVLALWRVFEMPQVQHAFLQFLAIGEVPGLKQPLSPKGVYMVVATLFSLSLILIFRQELIRSIRRYRPVNQLPAPTLATASQSVAASEALTISQSMTPTVPAMQTQIRKPEPSVIVIRRPHGTANLSIPAAKLRLSDKKLPVLYLPSIPSIMPAIWRLMDLEMRVIAAVYRAARIAGRWTWKYTQMAATRLWSWLEPYLRALDKRIEKRLQRNDVASEVLEIIGECWHTVRSRLGKTT